MVPAVRSSEGRARLLSRARQQRRRVRRPDGRNIRTGRFSPVLPGSERHDLYRLPEGTDESRPQVQHRRGGDERQPHLPAQRDRHHRGDRGRDGGRREALERHRLHDRLFDGDGDPDGRQASHHDPRFQGLDRLPAQADDGGERHPCSVSAPTSTFRRIRGSTRSSSTIPSGCRG